MRTKSVAVVLTVVSILGMSANGRPASPVGAESEAAGNLAAVDEFDGKLALDWEILHEEKSHYSLSKRAGALTLTPQKGRFVGFDADYKNLFLVPCPNAAGKALQATIYLSSFRPLEDGNQAGLIFYDDDDHYLTWVYRMRAKEPVFTALRETKGAFWKIENFSARADLSGVWLRVTKRDYRYEFATSYDGETFVTHGEMSWGDGAPKCVGLFAERGATDESVENDASFDVFGIARAPAAAQVKDGVPPSKYAIPAANLQIPENLQPCAASLRRITAAIDKYKKEKGKMPPWLSDLVPDYLPAEVLLCPVNAQARAPYYPDPKLPCSYTYEFSLAPVPTGWDPSQGTTVQDWKTKQLNLFGDVLPVVRCHCHGTGAVLSLSAGGQVYWSQVSWEYLFKQDYRFGEEVGPGPINLEGTAAPDFNAKDLDDKAVSLSDFRGKVLVLWFWATWSEDSLAGARRLAEVYRKHHEPGLEVLGVNLDRDVKRVRDYATENEIPWRQVCTGLAWETPAVETYGVRSVPFAILIDRTGTIRGVGVEAEGLDAAVAKALGGSAGR